MSYFNQLNYTLANEDTALELGILKPNLNHVMTVAGSGARVVPLLAKAPKQITCVDLVREQLYLTELRIEALRALSHSEYLAFWGYPPKEASPEERRSLFNQVYLTEPAKEFFTQFFEQIQWRAPLYEGKWERTISKLSRMNQWITREKGARIFTFKDPDLSQKYFSTRFPKIRWHLILLLLGNSNTFNALLYRGHFPKKNIKPSYFHFYRQAFERLFRQGPACQNFLLELLFFGKLKNASANPIECDRDVFDQAQVHLRHTAIEYRCGDIVRECENAKTPVDFLSLSDVPSYFAGELEQKYMQQIRKGLSDQAVVVLRHYLRIPEGTDLTGFLDQTPVHRELIAREKVQMYQIEVYQKGQPLSLTAEG